MNLLRSDSLITFFVVSGCMLGVYLIFGFYYSEYESLNIALLSGSLTPGMPFRSVYFSGNLGISYLYSLLYENLPGVEWISWLEYAFLFIAAFIACYMLSILLADRFGRACKLFLLAVFYFLIFTEHHIQLLYTRVAYMMCGVSLIALVVFFDSPAAIKSRWRLFLLLNLFFTAGTLIRNESAIACLLLLFFFGAFYLQNIRQWFLLFVYPFTVVASLSAFLMLDIRTASPQEFYKQVEPDIEEQLIARKNLAPLSYMKTNRDSVLYMAASSMIWSDPRVVTPDFLRSLILPENFIFTDLRQWERVYGEFSVAIAKYWYLVLITLMLGATLYYRTGFQKSRFTRMRWLAFELSFWALLVVQTYVDKLNERSFTPYISLFILCHIILLIRHNGNRLSRWHYAVVVSVFLLTAIQVYFLKQASNLLRKDLIAYQENFEGLKKSAHGKYLALNSSSFDCLFPANVPFCPFDFSAFKKVYITEGYVIPFLPYYKRYLEKACDCNLYDFPGFWNYLKSLRQEVVIISAPDRIEITKKYLEKIHQFSLPLTTDNSLPPIYVQSSYAGRNPDEIKAFVFAE